MSTSDTQLNLEQRFSRLEGRIAELEQQNKSLQRAKDVLEIQNVMSMHEYYHTASMHQEEIDNIWAQKTPGVAFEEAALIGRNEGLEAIKACYVKHFDKFLKAAAEDARLIFPHLAKEKEAPYGVRIVHTLTTPVIEVAEDGQTAKGMWLSPGHMTLPVGARKGRGKMQAFWQWDKYAVDFVKEDGKWKIWHLYVGTDFCTPYETSWVESALAPAAGPEFENSGSFPETNAPRALVYEEYSPFKVAKFAPKPPVPYKTFSETFSY